MEPSQFKLVIDDMIADLETQSVWEIQQAAAAWRQSGEHFFPTSGDLLRKIKERVERSVESARATAAANRAQLEFERKPASQLTPWREILRKHGRPIPPDDSPIAQGLDRLQNSQP